MTLFNIETVMYYSTTIFELLYEQANCMYGNLVLRKGSHVNTAELIVN